MATGHLCSQLMGPEQAADIPLVRFHIRCAHTGWEGESLPGLYYEACPPEINLGLRVPVPLFTMVLHTHDGNELSL